MQRTQLEKMWLIGAALFAFVLAVVGYLFFISPQRDDTSSVNDQIATAQTANLGLQTQIAQLAADNKKLPIYEQDLVKARAALPATSGVTDFLRTLQALGTATSTHVSTLAVSDPATVAAPVAAAPTGTASSSPAAAPQPQAAGSAGLYQIAINATVTGSDAALMNFLTQLQSVQPRAVLITGIAQSSNRPAATATQKLGTEATSITLTMSAFMAPDATPATGASTTPPAGP